MAKSLNRVELIGNLGGDVELRFTTGGQAVGNVNIATTRSYKAAGSEEWTEETEWTPLVIWGKSAENFTKYTSKGDKVFVSGRLQTRNWEDKETGQKRYKTEVVVEDFVLLGGKKDSGDTTPADRAIPPRTAQPARNKPAPVVDETDLPF
jgi:single-strand DNA-binding protein